MLHPYNLPPTISNIDYVLITPKHKYKLIAINIYLPLTDAWNLSIKKYSAFLKKYTSNKIAMKVCQRTQTRHPGTKQTSLVVNTWIN